MKKRMTLGVDFGGSSSKATLIDEDGRILATSTREYPSYHPHPGWVEQDPDELYGAFVYNVREILRKSGAAAEDISAVAVDAATHMMVFTDGNGRVLRPMIHWQDTRSTAQTAWLKEHCRDVIDRYSLNTVTAAWNLPQLLWLNENEPEVLENTKRIYFAKDYIRHRITGDFCTDYIEAMGAILSDDATGEWSGELCGIAGLDPAVLPPVLSPSDIAGTVCGKTAEETGLAIGTPVIVGTTDTALEVYASGAVEPGCATVKLATAGRICVISGRPAEDRHFLNYKHVVPGLWYPGTGTRSCASAYKWYRDVFGDTEKTAAEAEGGSAYELLNAGAEQVPAGCDGLCFHPYLLGEITPYFDDALRGSFTGVSMHHTKGYFTRAVMEGVAYSMRDCLDEIRRHDIRASQYRLIGGGAKGILWRQILCDVLNEPLTCTQNNDSSLGSAMLAGVACGMFESYPDSVKRCVRVSGKVTPDPRNVEIYERGFRRYRDIQKALASVYHTEY